jgi:hypothetical protein
MKAAARREERRDRYLVAADQRGEAPPGNLDEAHGSPALQDRAAPGEVVAQGPERAAGLQRALMTRSTRLVRLVSSRQISRRRRRKRLRATADD